MMYCYYIVWYVILLTELLYCANGETTEVPTTTPDNHHTHHNPDYPANYDDYQDPDYPVPDYYSEERGGRSLDNNDIPDPASDQNYLKQLESTIPGIPGVDYPMHHAVPDTSFRCDGRIGFYGDVEAQCQVFHICQEDGRHDSFICPVGTVFSQMSLVCDWWFNVNCADTPTFFESMKSGLEPMPRRMQDAMRKMRHFRQADDKRRSASFSKQDQQEMKKMQERMDHNRIMNLFSPKMRSANLWKRLRTSEKIAEDDMMRAATIDDRSDDYRSLRTTDVFGYTTADDLTTSLTTTDASPKTPMQKLSSEDLGSPEPTSQMSTIAEEQTGDYDLTNFTHSNQQHDLFVVNNTKVNNADLNENGIENTYTIPTLNDDTNITKDSNDFNEVPVDYMKNFNILSTPLVIDDGNETNRNANFEQDSNVNHMNPKKEIVFQNLQSKQHNNSMYTGKPPTSVTPISHQLAFNANPNDKNNSLSLGNDTHFSVSVTIRAGISRLKWKRLPEGMKMKKLKLKNTPITSFADSENHLPMDLMFRKRMMRKRPNSRIMWIPAQNDTLKRKSVWKIFVNSKPRNSLPMNTNEMFNNALNINKEVSEPIRLHRINEINEKRTEMDKIQRIEYIPSTTLQTENTEVAHTLMMPSETRVSDASPTSEITLDNPIALGLKDNRILNSESDFEETDNVNAKDYEKTNLSETVGTIPVDKLNENFEIDFNSKADEIIEGESYIAENEGCRGNCSELLQSTENIENETNNINYHPVSIFRQTTNSKDFITHPKEVDDKFGRRSYLRVSPSEQFSVKYDPDPKCNEDFEHGKVVIKGWSIIVDAGSVTKEKTVKRKGCDSLFNDSKIIVMQGKTPQRSNFPNRGGSKANYPQQNTPNNIRFASNDQQYWLTLVRNWLEGEPNSNGKAGHKSKNSLKQNKHRTQSTGGDNFVQPQKKYDVRFKDDIENPRPFQSQRNDKFGRGAANKQLNSNTDWSANENRKDNTQANPNKRTTQNNVNPGSISRRNFASDNDEKWTWRNDQEADVLSSQSNRKEWHVDAENKKEIYEDERIDKSGDNMEDQGVSLTKEAAQDLPRFRMNIDPFVMPNNDDRQYFTQQLGRNNVRGKRDWESQQSRIRADRPTSNGFSSDETSGRFLSNGMNYEPSGTRRDNFDRESQQNGRIEDNRPSSNLFFVGDVSKTPWSIDTIENKPSNSRYGNSDLTSQSNNRNQWTSDSDRNDDFTQTLTNFNPLNIDTRTNGNRQDLVDTNAKLEWSTKDTDDDWSSKSKINTNERPSPKNRDIDQRTANKHNRDGRHNSRHWDMGVKETWPLPDQMSWNVDVSKTSRKPKPTDENTDWSSSSSSKDKSWSPRDQQDKSDSVSDSKTDKTWSSKDQQGMADWGTDIKEDRVWSSKDQQGKTDWGSDSKNDKSWSSKDQQGMADWGTDSKEDRVWSSKDQQGKTDWSSDSKKDKAWSSKDQQRMTGFGSDSKNDKDWSSKDQQGKTDWTSDSSNNKAWSGGDQKGKDDSKSSGKSNKGWSSDSGRMKTDWTSDKRDSVWSSKDQQEKVDPRPRSKTNIAGSTDNQKSNHWPSGSQQGRPWSSGDQQTKADWLSYNKKTNDWNSRDQQEKADWANSNKGDGGISPSYSGHRKEFPSQNKNDEYPPLLKRKDRIPSSRKGTVRDTFQDTQKDISESSFKGIQEKSDDWSIKQNINRPIWSTDENNSPPIINKNDDAWILDNRKDESMWYDAHATGDTKVSSRSPPKKHDRSDWNKNTPDVSDSRIWDSDNPPSDGFTQRFNVNSPGQSTNTKGGSLRGNTRSTTQSTGSWDSDSKSSKGIPNLPGYKIQNRQSDWSKDDSTSSSIYPPNRRDEININLWNADEEFSTNSNIQKQSWSSDTNGSGRPLNIQPDWSSDQRKVDIPTKNKGDWSSNPRENRMLKSNEEDWSSNKKASWSSEPTVRRMSKTNDSGSSKKNSNWSTESSRTPTSKINRGSGSGWDKGSVQSTKGQNTDDSWTTKGSTKTATPTSRDWNNPPKTKPGTPWKDDKDPPTKVNNMKGEAGMKEEKIVWSHQISSNGDLGNGWVPVTLRPNLNKPVNQSRDKDNDKGTTKINGDWSGVKQQMDKWDSEGFSQNTPDSLFNMDLITESVFPSSSETSESSDNHPFYIPFVNKRRAKRENRLISITKNYIRPRTAKRIYKVINSSTDIESNKSDKNNRFYLASADILVGDYVNKRKNETVNKVNNSARKRRLFKAQIQVNETIKNSIPSLTRLKHLRLNLERKNSTLEMHNNSKELEIKNSIRYNMHLPTNLVNANLSLYGETSGKYQEPSEEMERVKDDLNFTEQNDKTFDSLMEESETKELWSSPFDSSNIPESGWIPLFKVNKTSVSSSHASKSYNQTNTTTSDDTEYTVSHPKDLEETETVIIFNSRNVNSENDTEISESYERQLPKHNFTIDIDTSDSELNSEHSVKDGNRILRIIPFSDIMKQLRQNESSDGDIEVSTSQEDVKDEWNMPVMATPKMYALKLVNETEMQNQNIGSSWTFAKGKPKGVESWVLVKSDGAQNRTSEPENNSTAEDRQQKEHLIPKSSSLFRIIIGNKTKDRDLSEDNHHVANDHHNNNSNYPLKNAFSFDLNNWHKDSGWTPLIRAIGSVTTRKIDHGKSQSTT